MKELNNVKLRVSRLFPAFKERMQLMEKITLISGKSQRTFDNYSMYLAIFVEKVQKMPEDASDEEYKLMYIIGNIESLRGNFTDFAREDPYWYQQFGEKLSQEVYNS